MRALSYADYGRLEMTETPVPVPQEGELLIRVAAAAICGSELDAFRSRSPRRPPPLILGHEFCGIVAEVGPGVADIAPGARVVCNAVISCGTCFECADGMTHLCADRQLFGMHRPGAFAEFVAAPRSSVIEWPETLPAEAACLAEPLANGIHMVDLTRHLPARNVLVIGAGPIGLMAQQAFQILRGSATVVSDLSPERRAVAESLGARRVVDPMVEDLGQVCREQTGGRGMDLVIDAVGSGATKAQSIDLVRPGGAAVWIGLHDNTVSLDTYGVTLMERQILGTYAATPEQLRQAVTLLAEKQVVTEPWIKRFPLARAVEAFERMLAAQGDDIKAVILPELGQSGSAGEA